MASEIFSMNQLSSYGFIFLSLLTIYVVLYFSLKINRSYSSVGNVIDFMILGVAFLFTFLYLLFSWIYQFDPKQIAENIRDEYLNYIDQFYSLISFGVIFVMFYIFQFIFQTIHRDHSFVVSLTEILLWFTLVFIIAVQFFKHVFNISIIDLLRKLWSTPTPTTTTNPIPTTEPPPTEEVFHVQNNLYAYRDAEAVCSALGATLADYKQVEQHYQNGGEFCGYGWSADQMALFPTQQKTWDELQKGKSPNSCGRPGVNGGKFDPEMKFGVNCFGVKPQPTEQDKMCVQNSSSPKSAEQLAIEQKAQYFKDNADKLLNLTAFNKSRWSEWKNNVPSLA
jgi:hypothetical protein